MPYRYEYEPAEVFLEHNGVTIYHVYKDDDPDQGRRTYWFDNKENSSDTEGFDVRDLAVDPKVIERAAGKELDTRTDPGQKEIIRLAIDAGLIENGDEEDEEDED